MTDIQRITLDEVVLHFEELEDPRSTVNRNIPWSASSSSP